MSLLFLWPSRIIDIFWRDSVKPRNVSVRTPSVPCQYSIKYTLNTQPDCCTAKLFGIALLGKLESVDCANLVGFLARAGMFRVGQFSGQGRDVSCWPIFWPGQGCFVLANFLVREGMFRVGQFSGQGRDVSCWPIFWPGKGCFVLASVRPDVGLSFLVPYECPEQARSCER